jgi:hypothetical protein
MQENSKTIIRAGIHSGVELSRFTEEEQKVIKKFSGEWYVTSAGTDINLSRTSNYKYFLIKPTSQYQELFNIEREIIVIFSDYEEFLPRTLDAFDEVFNRHGKLRIDRVCSVLVSKDSDIEIKIKRLLTEDQENQIVVPFFCDEFLKNKNDYFIRGQFEDYFYKRDLFDFKSALKKDLYFFGRGDLVHEIVSRHRSGENSGLFGLRKTGKTSIVYGVKRVITADDGVSVVIDCQSPAFHKKNWFSALRHVIEQIRDQNNIPGSLRDESKYSEENAASAFESDLLKLLGRIKQKKILLIFDEIEQITPGISGSEHWRNDSDFVFFWQTLRSLFQKYDQLFTYLIVGTNPKCVEIASINGIDNPIFSQIPCEYIPSFDVPQTREMVRTLGKIMGLKFQEIIYSKLTEDFGGHPFLIRNVCSAIYKIVANEKKPIEIDRSIYELAVKQFNENSYSYIEMILGVLKEHYDDEYEMLKYLSLGDIDTFNEFSALSKEYTSHLLGYDILERNRNSFNFKIEAVKNFLIEHNKYRKINMSEEEIRREISDRRNNIEIKLRKIVRQVLQAKYGEKTAMEKVISIVKDSMKDKNKVPSYKDLFDPRIANIYFNNLKDIILKDWDIFKNIFGGDDVRFKTDMQLVNKHRTPDAHAGSITKSEMEEFRNSIEKLEKYVSNYD